MRVILCIFVRIHPVWFKKAAKGLTDVATDEELKKEFTVVLR